MRQTPSVRVGRAMARLSRDKWLSGEEVRRVTLALAMCASPARPHWVAQNAIRGECEHVGMIRGRPPAFVFEQHYGEVLRAVKNLTGNCKIAPEIALLQTVRKL